MPQSPSHLFLLTRPSRGLPRPYLRPPSNDLGGSLPSSLLQPPNFRTLAPSSPPFSLTHVRAGTRTCSLQLSHILGSLNSVIKLLSSHSLSRLSSKVVPLLPILVCSLLPTLVKPPQCIATHAPFLPLSSLLLVNLLLCSDFSSLLSPLMPLSWVLF